QTANSLEPEAPTNLSITQTSAYFVNLSWTPSPDADVIGYKIYQNDVLIAYTKDTSISIDHLEPSTFYNFKVQAYDNSYYQSMYSNTVSATTLATDIYAKDLMITKYLEGSENNKAIEITNKTGHPVNLNKYRLSTQFYNNTAGNYYFPDAYELEGLVQHNETFVVLNPYSNFSCITNDEARFVTAAPQLTFSGSQYLELRYASTTVDAVGIKDMSNSSVLGDVSLYRLSSVTQPSNTFTLSEWEAFPADYCENLGVLATSDVGFYSENNWSVYPNPVVGNSLYVKGKQLENVQEISVFDLSGKLVQQESRPFRNKNSVNVQNLKAGVYILNIDHKSLKFIKK
ncbi:T9SS type A sorting domain-containing protein, partial [Kaistella sp.]|uniref:T9SS type A sorting domain-containing protein n=1 Tax=Kaistella sp. TaxID=2782235 RepID=UPI002F949167